MFKNTIIFLLIFLSSCSQTPNYQVIIVHPEKQFIGSDKIITEISSLKNVILVVSEENTELISDINYCKKIISPAGFIDVNYPKVEFAGGYFNACLKNSIFSWSENRKGQGIAIINMKRVYFGRFRTLYQEYKDNYKNDAEFIDYLKTQSFRGINLNIKINGDYIICQLMPI